eukprot:363790-Chlamydomonas_euryale.AAC.15
MPSNSTMSKGTHDRSPCFVLPVAIPWTSAWTPPLCDAVHNRPYSCFLTKPLALSPGGTDR